MNLSDKARSIIASVAPVLGTAIGGPFGSLAGAIISKAVAPDAKPGDTAAIDAAITTADPQTLLALKQAEENFQVQMKQLNISEEKLAYDDMANARAREVSVRDSTPRNLAYLLVSATLLAIAGTLLGYTKVDSALAGTLIGYLVAESRSTLVYYFGSSAGSKAKDQALADVVANKQ